MLKRKFIPFVLLLALSILISAGCNTPVIPSSDASEDISVTSSSDPTSELSGEISDHDSSNDEQSDSASSIFSGSESSASAPSSTTSTASSSKASSSSLSVSSSAPSSSLASSGATPTVTAGPTPVLTPPAGSIPAVVWNMKEISFTSSYQSSTILDSGIISTFESSSVPSAWTAPYGGGALTISETTANSGTRSLKMGSRADTWNSPAINIYSYLKQGGSGTYVISLWVYVDKYASGTSSGRLLVRGGNSSDANSFIKLEGSNYFGIISSMFATPANTWTKYTGVIVVEDSDISRASGTFSLCIDTLAGAAGQNLYFDDLQIHKSHYVSSFDDVQMDVTFTGPGNTTLKIPAFWDGGSTWRVRFAPTKAGVWTYKTTCNDTTNTGLHNKSGTVFAAGYTGDLEIYKRGFIQVQGSKRYFTYADGTPFFYVGDTHWNMPSQPFDTSSVPGIPSQFKHIVDKRVEQGFTVYQSEPIGAQYNLANGVQDSDIIGFQDLDRRFDYIASKGLVHANAQLFFAAELVHNLNQYSYSYLQKLSRYWVARYGAYPVLWTTAQEVDNDFYYNRPGGGQTVFSAANNPWKAVAQATHSADAYKHPLTAHMEYASTTDPHGTVASTSSFKDLAGHNWFGAQWSPGKSNQISFAVPKNFWNNGKITVNYEGLYDHLWTKHFGSRAQGWNAYLNGMFGYGYGAIDIWLYNSTYDMDSDTVRDGETITVADKQTKWNVSVEFPSAWQMGYMKEFFNSIEWWNLTPRFDDISWFVSTGGFYSISTISNNVYVVYFYNQTVSTGTLKGMSNAQYEARWYNPRTNEYGAKSTITPVNGNHLIGLKPDGNDWVFIAVKK
jgi:hypothetical protein